MTTMHDEHYVEFWYADDKAVSVELVKAFPRGGDMYWVPDKGTSASKDLSLFDTRGEAVARVRGICANDVSKANMKLARAEKL